MKTFKIYLIITLLLASIKAEAQFKSVELSVSGLTCSMCSFATEKSLRTLDFVADVIPDLNTNLFVITFKPGKKVSIDMIEAKVKSAGFSVYKLVAVFGFDNIKVTDGYRFNYAGDQYEFLNIKDKTLNGDIRLTFMDKDLSANAKPETTYHVTL